ncbi:MAG: hypothetical protein H0W02_24030 [Ktedonobacteraceae bacterium]|nr:hypothetical protein [Ktedonobacteraceae bacterium]
MSGKYRTLLLLTLVVIVVLSGYLLIHRRADQLYTYNGLFPDISTAQSGDHIKLIWATHDEVKDVSAMAITLKIVLVDAKIANQQPCGMWHPSILLDELHITNTDRSSYTRTIAIPQHIQPGTYILEMVVQRADGSCSSQGGSFTISS